VVRHAGKSGGDDTLDATEQYYGRVSGCLTNQMKCIPSRPGFNRCWSGLRWANSKGSFEFELTCVTFLRLADVVGVEGSGDKLRF